VKSAVGVRGESISRSQINTISPGINKKSSEVANKEKIKCLIGITYTRIK